MYKQEELTNVAPFNNFSPPSSNIGDYIMANPPVGELLSITDIGPMPILRQETLDANILGLSPSALNEDTMDVAKLEFYEFPVSPRGPPPRAVFAGDADFQVEIHAAHTHRKKYLYSHLLNRMYVDMRTSFPVQFRWVGGAGPQPAYVRATAVFADHSQAEKRVERCTQHTHDTTNADLSQEIVKNVLHSSREMGTQGVYYCGHPDMADSWYSVLVQMGAAGVGTHAYQFVCKNSCSSGINRRAIEVLFTLEDYKGHVYGRQSVGARVCACPRRDMLRDEETEGAYKSGKKRVQCNRVQPPPPPPPGQNGAKKIKLEARAEPRVEVAVDTDDTVITLPPVAVVGSRAVVAGLNTMLSMMEQGAALTKSDAAATEKYNRSITELRKTISELKKQ